MNTIAIIPARGGSETIVDKNILPIAGKPLIEYTIEAVKNAKCIIDERHWFVYTDKYTDYNTMGIIRPKIVSGSQTPMNITISKAIETYEFLYGNIDNVILLQPNCPFLNGSDIDKAYEIFSKGIHEGHDCLVSVMVAYNEKKYYKNGHPLKTGLFCKQVDRALYQRNSAIFIFKKSLLRSRGLIFDEHPLFYKMPRWRSIDIDRKEDVFMAECLIKGGALSENI